ncbi:MAG: trypsin-like peptidase domain-containing protein [Candidatus Symbiothrix sp.]|jgi:hypothetical protein|nr:trypsin-like peptidase domain-containing protein [Candidatus Symbiothrix sp.]
MKNKLLLLGMFCLLAGSGLQAQISYGGSPRFLDTNPLRNSGTNHVSPAPNASNPDFITMPAFDLDSVLQSDKLNERNMRGAYSFAYKFFTNIARGKDGMETVLPDGTRVWQVGIASRGAYSINLLFTEFEIPEGAQLFIYNANHSHVIGAFDARNNSPERLLPTRPVAGDSIIVEYSEPANAEFRGQLVIGEVNHDYRDVLRAEPKTDAGGNTYACMPDALFSNANKELIRSSLLLMINGNTLCSGNLINNTKNDGTPYVLTAVHCLNNPATTPFPRPEEYYVTQAGTIVAFFNYNRPVDDHQMKGSEEMSLAGAYPAAILERKDIALLEFKETPPDYYNAYFAGWNADTLLSLPSPPFSNLHHPDGAVTKYGKSSQNIVSYSYTEYGFDPKSHWLVPAWDTGSTHAGSSGSALFDNSNRIVGGLTGGISTCQSGGYDWFSSLNSGWAVNGGNNPLVNALDPYLSGIKQLGGFDPHAENPFRRAQTDAWFSVAPVIGQKAKEFNETENSDLFGVFVQMPATAVTNVSNALIKVYLGKQEPTNLVKQQSVATQYVDYNSTQHDFEQKDKTMTVPTETFVAFDSCVSVGKHFYVTYQTPTGQSSQALPADIQPLLRDGSLSPEPVDPMHKMWYVRADHQVVLSETEPAAGELRVYSVTGQFVETIALAPDQQEAVLQPQAKGTIGIVRVVRGQRSYVIKIVY